MNKHRDEMQTGQKHHFVVPPPPLPADVCTQELEEEEEEEENRSYVYTAIGSGERFLSDAGEINWAHYDRRP